MKMKMRMDVRNYDWHESAQDVEFVRSLVRSWYCIMVGRFLIFNTKCVSIVRIIGDGSVELV